MTIFTLIYEYPFTKSPLFGVNTAKYNLYLVKDTVNKNHITILRVRT